MNEFYCNACMKWEHNSVKSDITINNQPICKDQAEKVDKRKQAAKAQAEIEKQSQALTRKASKMESGKRCWREIDERKYDLEMRKLMREEMMIGE